METATWILIGLALVLNVANISLWLYRVRNGR